jgi:hypothetical protein
MVSSALNADFATNTGPLQRNTTNLQVSDKA